MSPVPGVPSGPAALVGLVTELNSVRANGLLRLRSLTLPLLHSAAVACGYAEGDEVPPEAVENLLTAAVGQLSGETSRRAAEFTFGVGQGSKDWYAQDRRREAAKCFRVGTEWFRRNQEKLVIEQTAEAVLSLCRARRTPPAPSSRAPSPAQQQAPPSPERSPDRPPRSPQTVPVGFAHGTVPITVHTLSIELLSDVDVLVASENTYLEMSRTFRHTTSGRLRRAGARQDAAGAILEDLVAAELQQWLVEFASPGLPVAPGTVVATSSGALAARSVRRIYHAAVVSPRGDGGYEVSPGAVETAVTRIFACAAAERDAWGPPLRSVGLPLLGAGRGGLAPEDSLRRMLAALGPVLARDPAWDVHLVAHRWENARMAVDVLAGYGLPAPRV
ncbi:macro domain-containing protein [Streptomyces cyaneofuscatus]|uniref:macro domain-containing protein n=1 Tax=Streptomyces cyaneofuscatus TaxID=66883 RepID=UPI0037B8127C